MAQYRRSPLQAQYALIGNTTLILAGERNRILVSDDGTILNVTDPFTVLWTTQRTVNAARRKLFKASGKQFGNELVVPFTSELANAILQDPHGKFRKTLDHLAHLTKDRAYNIERFEKEMAAEYGLTGHIKAA